MIFPERHDRTITQRFDISQMIESRMSELDLPAALSELIDNAWDERGPGKLQIGITFDNDSKRFELNINGTTGMDPAKMNEFVVWGGKRQEPDKIGEHRQGGKLATLFLSNQVSKFIITSHPPNNQSLYKLEIVNWWQKLNEREEFPVTVSQVPVNPNGHTYMEICGARSDRFPSDLASLADKIGLIYGPLLASEKMKITLRNISDNHIDDVIVPPVLIQFAEGNKTINGLPTGHKGNGPKIDVSWGLLDPEKMAKEKTRRANYYKVALDRRFPQTIQADGDKIYFYYSGRLIETTPLSRLGIPGYTSRGLINTFAIQVNILGWASKTVLKDRLNVTDPATDAIRRKVVTLVTDYVMNIIRGADPEHIAERYAPKTTDASQKLTQVLEKMFEGNLAKISEVFSLPMRQIIYESDKDNQEKQHQEPKRRIFGDRKPKVDSVFKKTESHQTEFDSEPKREDKIVQISPIPKFVVSPGFPDGNLEASLTVNENEQAVIIMNYRHPLVSYWLKQSSRQFTTYALSVAANLLYSEKWRKIAVNAPNQVQCIQIYEDGVKSDSDNFFAIAEKLKIL
jgi:hypothetical protein